MNKALLPLIFLLPICLSAQNFKVVGYLPHYRFDKIEDLNLDQLTHLNIAFANPTMSGDLEVGKRDLSPVIERAKRHRVKTMISLGGGALLRRWKGAWDFWLRPENRSEFVHKMIAFLRANDLDGIDVDLEWEHVDQHYNDFVLELKDSLAVHELLFFGSPTRKLSIRRPIRRSARCL